MTNASGPFSNEHQGCLEGNASLESQRTGANVRPEVSSNVKIVCTMGKGCPARPPNLALLPMRRPMSLEVLEEPRLAHE